MESDRTNSIGFSVGVKDEYKDHVRRFSDYGYKIFCIDIAHGDSDRGVDMTTWIRTHYPETLIISGNVATGEGAKRLWNAGADVVKVGVGPGSLCTTRIETGNGVPQLTALIDVAKARLEQEDAHDQHPYYIISDGGIKNAGDMVKALCFSDMVMAGNVFAGSKETPGTVLSIMGKTYKEYKGSSTHKTNHVEGVAAIVPTKGSFNSILNKLLEGLRSGCSYQGAHKLIELQDNPEFVRITNAGLVESHPHNIMG
jgi:IMP dehydrogenase